MSDSAVMSRPGHAAFGATADGRAAMAGASALSWAAVLGGTVVATSVTLVLIALGSGIGLAWVSPLGSDNPTATEFTLATAIWLIVVQWLAAAMGGYITGRLRTRWIGTHTHEVFFRDTAHGFLTWATSKLVVIGLIAATSSAILATGVGAAGHAAGGAAQTATALVAARDYDVDSMLRAAQPGSAAATTDDARAEIGRILARAVANGELAASDRGYLTQLVMARAGISQADAEKRVDAAVADAQSAAAKAKQVADAAWKAAAKAAIFAAVSMLIGAFIACAAAAFGGSLRDEHP